AVPRTRKSVWGGVGSAPVSPKRRNPDDPDMPLPADDPGPITDLLLAWRGGQADAMDELVPLRYAAMRRLAERHLERERNGHTLTPTALVNEAWLRLVEQTRVRVNDRTPFLALVSRTMRHILVDHARRRDRKS